MKTKMRRAASGLLALLITVVAAGCDSNSGSSSDSGGASTNQLDAAATNAPEDNSGGGSEPAAASSEPIKLTYWHYEDETTINALAERFMAIHPNITVETKLIDDMSTDLSAAAAAREFPDVFSGTDSDTALANQYWRDITSYVENDPETKFLMGTIEEYGIGKFDTNVRYAMPTWYQPSAIFIDKNVMDKLNLEMPRTNWTWDEMIQLIKSATVDDRTGMKYYGLGYYNRLDSLYGIAATSPEVRRIKGEFGYNGTDFDLSYWATGEQQFADLKLGGYVAPQQDTQAMEDWAGDWSTWFGATGHVAIFSEGFWTFQNLWNTTVDGTPYQDFYGLDIYPYVTPSVVEEKEHNVIGNMYMGGISTSCEHPDEAYELLKFMGWGIDGWNARLDLYEDKSNVNASGVPLQHANMPVPITLDTGVWERYKKLFPTDEEHGKYWEDFFASITRPVPYGWYNIAGYWNFCDQYFNKIGIHDLVDAGTAKSADYVDEATRQANYYHAEAMIAYFGPDGYDILSEDEIATYQATIDSFAQ